MPIFGCGAGIVPLKSGASKDLWMPPNSFSNAGSEYVWPGCLEGWQKDPENCPSAALIEQAKRLISNEHPGAWGKAALERVKQIKAPGREDIPDMDGYDE